MCEHDNKLGTDGGGDLILGTYPVLDADEICGDFAISILKKLVNDIRFMSSFITSL